MKKTFLFILFILVCIAIAIAYYTFQNPSRISAAEAKYLIRNRKFDIILDVRTDFEYKLGHYPNALHIPTKDLQIQAPRKIPNRNASILVYCNTGQRARYAADLLKSIGYKKVKYITGPHTSIME